MNAAGQPPTNNYKKEAFFYIKPSPVPHSRSLSCTGSDPHVLLLAVMLADVDKVVTALWPGAGDGLEAGVWGCGCVGVGVWPCWPQGIPACLGGWWERRAASTAELINQQQRCRWRYLADMHSYTDRNALSYSWCHMGGYFCLVITSTELPV